MMTVARPMLLDCEERQPEGVVMLIRQKDNIARRRQGRLELKMVVGVAVVSRLLGRLVGKPQFQCVIQDVSFGGVGLVSDRPIPTGKGVKLWVSLANDEGKPLELNGRVCWSSARGTNRFLAGISLDEHPRSSMAAWAGRVRERIREHFNPVQQSSELVLDQWRV